MSAAQSNALERTLKLAFLLDAASRSGDRGAKAADIREAIYPHSPSDDAFRRQFERDKKALRNAGLVLQVHKPAEVELTYIDQQQTYRAIGNIDRGEMAAIGVAVYSALTDETFPLKFAARTALKRLIDMLGDEQDEAVSARTYPIPEAGRLQGEVAETVLSAIRSRKCVSISYTNAAGTASSRTVAPYGIHLLGGRWYLVGKDSLSKDVRTFAMIRIGEIEILAQGFDLPDDFDIHDAISLPFEYAPPSGDAHERTATITIPSNRATTTQAVTRGRGLLSPQPDGSVEWTVAYRDIGRLCRFVLENGYLFAVESAAERAHLASLLAASEVRHG